MVKWNWQWPWIARTTYQQLARTTEYIRHAYNQLTEREAGLQREVRDQHAQLQAALSEIADYRERTAQAEGARDVARAYTDLLRVRVNELTVERAALMLKVVPGLDLVTPRIERDPSVTHMGAGFTFDDMGDAAAALHGFPVPAAVKTGLAGANPTPAPAVSPEFDTPEPPLAEAGIEIDPGGPSEA